MHTVLAMTFSHASVVPWMKRDQNDDQDAGHHPAFDSLWECSALCAARLQVGLPSCLLRTATGSAQISSGGVWQLQASANGNGRLTVAGNRDTMCAC
jgi:hypothetical protein